MACRSGAAVMIATFLRRLLITDRAGATMVELAFLVALISVAIIGALHTYSNQLNNTFLIASNNINLSQ
jgi:Flp pilus assembly pilin Flp